MSTLPFVTHRGKQSPMVRTRHGLLLADSGIAYTWGDNRFGQLGREPVAKEENGRPPEGAEGAEGAGVGWKRVRRCPLC